jgi:hypothetical protein
MRFKLDENLGRRCQGLFRAAGHDAQTVLEESLSGATDRQIYDACRSILSIIRGNTAFPVLPIAHPVNAEAHRQGSSAVLG